MGYHGERSRGRRRDVIFAHGEGKVTSKSWLFLGGGKKKVLSCRASRRGSKPSPSQRNTSQSSNTALSQPSFCLHIILNWHEGRQRELVWVAGCCHPSSWIRDGSFNVGGCSTQSLLAAAQSKQEGFWRLYFISRCLFLVFVVVA